MVDQQYFLSYSRADAAIALQLARELKNANINIWIDQLDIEAGSLWDAEIEKALQNCNGLLFIASKASVASPNTLNEVHYAIRENKSVIPVRIDDCKIPLLIIRHNYIDLSTNYYKGFTHLIGRLTGGDSGQPLYTTDDRASFPESKKKEGVATQSKAKVQGRKWRVMALFTGLLILVTALFLWLGKNINDGANLAENENAPSGIQVRDASAEQSSATADALYEAGQAAYEKKDYLVALKNFQKSAEVGNISAMADLGYMYVVGEGVEKDHPTALEWLSKAAGQGHTIAMYYLADLYETGEGITRDYKKAMHWYTKAADGGYKYAFANIGDLYYEGKGVGVNYKIACEWYQKAMNAGEPNGTHSLAQMYENGWGVAVDQSKAAELYQKAKEWGYQEE